MDDKDMLEIKSEILDMLKVKRLSSLRNLLDTLNPADIAEIMEDFLDEEEITMEQLPVLYRILPKDLAADVFVEMNADMQEKLISSFTDTETKEVMDDMFLDDIVDVIEEMPANVVNKIFKNVDANTRKNINTILNYPEDSAGSIMTIEYVRLSPDETVADAFSDIRKSGVDKETIYICYVTKQKKLVGVVTVRELLLADYEDLISDIMEPNVISVRTVDDKEEVAQMLSKYDFTALPVVDREDRLVGIVTVDDAIDVLTEEATEDIEMMAGITPSEHPYLRSSVLEIVLQRVPWLMLLMLSATFTGIILNNYENALSAQMALTAYIPMIMGTGGNSGTQASTAVIRGISIGDIEFTDLFEVIWKEIRISVMCGIALAIAAFAKIMLVDHLIMGNNDISAIVALTVCLAVAGTVFVAKVIGSMLPLLAKKIGLDPAVMAAPLLSTRVDALSLTIYMKVATLLLGL